MKKNVEERLEENWRTKIIISGAPVENKNVPIEMQSHFESICDGYLGPIIILKRQIVVSQADAKPNRSPPFGSCLKEREVEKNEIDRLLIEAVMRTPRTEWAARKCSLRTGTYLLAFSLSTEHQTLLSSETYTQCRALENVSTLSANPQASLC